MTDEVVELESAAEPEVQAKAEKMGWIPPSRYKGAPDRFVDAEAYIERGETVLPIVKEQLRRTNADLARVAGENKELATALKAAQTAIDEIEERHTVATQKAVEQARKDLKAQLKIASAEGDHDAVAEITEEMTRLTAAETDVKPAAKKEDPPATAEIQPDLKEWMAEAGHEWFGTNKRKTALALAVAQEFREAGNTTQGRAFYDLVDAEVEKTFATPRPAGKVEQGRSGDGDSRSTGKKGYAALPADAKAQCDIDGKQFVGEGKRYKDQAAWRARYAEIYFEEK